MRIQRIAYEARGTGVKFVGKRLAKLLSEKLGNLVLEPFASLIRERQIPGVGANAQNLRIDKLDRALFAGLRRYAGRDQKEWQNQAKRYAEAPKLHVFCC